MKSTVYFIDLRATYKDNLFQKLQRLLETAGLADVVKTRDLVAVKLHFGEQGNSAFIKPVLVARVVEAIQTCQGIPFLTDANTLYTGTRSDAVHHIRTAMQNGFAYPVVDAPIIIADGLRGKSATTVAIDQKQFKEVYIANEIVQADALISLAHFKGHELVGFGGTLKNLGMGCASRKGKLAQHSTVSPKVKLKKCIGCGDCLDHCSQAAIAIVAEKAVINADQCIGCGECILICTNRAIQIRWNQSIPAFMQNMIEYSLGVLKGKARKALFVNFLTDVSPECDCHPYNDAPIVRDIGVVASRDPVAVDQASVDLVNQEPSLPGSCLAPGLAPGDDKFKALFPKVDWTFQFDYAEQLGLGTRNYVLEKL